jgi:hypothetical protein
VSTVTQSLLKEHLQAITMYNNASQKKANSKETFQDCCLVNIRLAGG